MNKFAFKICGNLFIINKGNTYDMKSMWHSHDDICCHYATRFFLFLAYDISGANIPIGWIYALEFGLAWGCLLIGADHLEIALNLLKTQILVVLLALCIKGNCNCF